MEMLFTENRGVMMFVVLPSGSPLKRELRARAPHETLSFTFEELS